MVSELVVCMGLMLSVMSYYLWVLEKWGIVCWVEVSVDGCECFWWVSVCGLLWVG